MKGFLRQPSERRLAIVAGVVIGVWMVVSFIIQPMWNRKESLRLAVEAKMEKLEAVNRLIGESGTIEQSYANQEGFFAAESEEVAQRGLLAEIESLSRTSSLQLNLKPKQTKQQNHADRFEIELEVQGPQAQLLGFLDSLFGLPKLVSIQRLRITTVPAQGDVLRANLVIQGFVLSK